MTKTATVDESQPVHRPRRLLAEAREQSGVSGEEIHAFLEGSAERAAEVRMMMKELGGDRAIVGGPEDYEYTKAEKRELTTRKIARLALYLEKDLRRGAKEWRRDVVAGLQRPEARQLGLADSKYFDLRMSLLGMVDPQTATRIGVNLGLFGNAVRGNGTDEQVRYWLQERGLALMKNVYGCFAMTELGHGSNVANLQTRATYDTETDTFVIDTPDLVATKWWIGGAAHSATHSVVYARLIVEGKDYGVKTFVVPLRDPETMELACGVTIGDIGAKMGRDGIDNGWIQFHNVVIPREFMLSRFTRVVPGKPPKVELEPLLDSISGYAALLGGRVEMVMDSYRFASKFVTIATRYAVGRQQFGDAQGETQLIDYPLHQYRLIPNIALTYMIAPGATKLRRTYDSCLGKLYSVGDNKKELAAVSAMMKDLFVESASLKATYTWLVAALIDELRQACGGHGYSSYNGFGQGYADWVVQCTWEGDNNVLSLTAGKSILKKFGDVVRGRNVETSEPSMDYLSMDFIQRVVMGGLAKKVSQLSSDFDYAQIWAVLLVKYLKQCGETVRATKDVDSISKLLVNLSKFHAFYSMLQEYHRSLSSGDQVHDEGTKEVLWLLYKVFSLYYIDKFSGEFQRLKVITPDQMTKVFEPQLLQFLPELKAHCVKLTDAFHFPDTIINAPIGYYDGDIYQNYFNEVTKVAAKETSPGVAPYISVLTSALGRGSEFERLVRGDAALFKKLSK